MSGIVLSASVRQNLLALQSIAALLAKTQNDLATGNKVNSALDDPTNFFTAEGLNNRASDISNLLDAIGNGVQVLKAANTGITSLQQLIARAKSIGDQALQQPTGYSSKATFQSNAPTGTAALGVAGTTTDLTHAGTNSLQGQLLVIKTATGTTTLTVSNVSGANNFNSISGLNTLLSNDGIQLTASLNSNGSVTFTSTNDAAPQVITNTGTYAAPPATASSSLDISGGAAFTGGTIVAAVADLNAQACRASLVAQYNQVIQQINTTAQDSSFNGINLLNGDTLKLVFNDTGRSTLSIQGVTFNDAGLGLSSLTVGTDFVDGNSVNKVLAQLDSASTTLRAEASALGSNLSIVQIRQNFNKNLINMLQTGASTLADTNGEAANSQALAIRRSIAVCALALANQSRASVLQLLR
jgi:flagellin-like hook-associated protein FlgL